MGFTFHNLYSHKATLLLGWSHRYTNYTVVITIRLTVRKNPYLKWQWIFHFLRRCFLSSITAKTFTWLYIWVTRRGSYQKQELLTRHEHLSSPRGGLRVDQRFCFLICPIMCLYFLSFVFWCPLRFLHKTMFGSSLPAVVCRRARDLLTLFVFVCA